MINMINTFKRCEKKFLITKKQLDTLIPYLEMYMEKDKFCKNNKNYEIYNVYYDTDDNNIIRHSLSKPYYKEKLRMRSYTIPESGNDTVFLELKKKIGGIVYKRRAALTLNDAKAFTEHNIKPHCSDYINNQVINEIDYFLKTNNVKPKAYISYTRTAFFGKEDPQLRITFDSNITTRRTEVRLDSPRCGVMLLPPDKYLMEIKICGAMEIWLAKILSQLKIYPCSFSKYGTEYKQYYSNLNENLIVNL